MQNKTPVKRVHKKGKNIFKIIIPIVLLSIFIFWIFNSTFFNIKTINIDNNKTLLKEGIIKQSKLIKGNNIFTTSIKDTERNLNKNPFIKSVSVKKQLPNIINIEIEERNRTFNLKYLSKHLIVDEEGVILEDLKVPNKSLPIVKGFNTQRSKIGENIFLNEENVNLKIFLDESKSLKILAEMEEIDKDFANDINIKLNNRISVAFGTLDNVKYKLSLLKEILVDIEEKDIKAKKIIMNKGDHPILKLDE